MLEPGPGSTPPWYKIGWSITNKISPTMNKQLSLSFSFTNPNCTGIPEKMIADLDSFVCSLVMIEAVGLPEECKNGCKTICLEAEVSNLPKIIDSYFNDSLYYVRGIFKANSECSGLDQLLEARVERVDNGCYQTRNLGLMEPGGTWEKRRFQNGIVLIDSFSDKSCEVLKYSNFDENLPCRFKSHLPMAWNNFGWSARIPTGTTLGTTTVHRSKPTSAASPASTNTKNGAFPLIYSIGIDILHLTMHLII